MSEGKPVRVHSVAEVYLWLMLQRCAACAQGPVMANPALQSSEENHIRMATRCGACGATAEAVFEVLGQVSWPKLHGQVPVDEPGRHRRLDVASGLTATINATDEASETIDVTGWLTLASIIAETARVETNPSSTRVFNFQVSRCLDEALKFYLPGEELPPANAFFDESALRQFRERPELFARSRLIGWKGRLPVSKS
jgi:hypothetical protein